MGNNSALPSYSLSYWEKESFFSNIETLIIGSGIVGLSAAIHLKERRPDRRVVVLERGPLPIGASTRNAGFACFGSLSELLDDASERPLDEVITLAAERYRGLRRLRERLGDATIDYRPYGGYELFRASENERFQSCRDMMDTYNRALSSVTGRDDTYRLAGEKLADFGFAGVQQLIHNQAEGQIHTGKMMATLLSRARILGVDIYNGVGVDRLEDSAQGVEVRTELGWILRAENVLVATNGFAARLLPDLAVAPARNQVLITKPVPGLPFAACFHYDRGYYYFRNIDGRILLGGGRNIDPTGETTTEFGTTPPIRRALLELLHSLILPDRPVEVDSWWSGIMGVGTQKQPIVQRLSDHVVVAVRMGGMGVAIGSLVGERGGEMLV
ncbi:NAD(P)/FAD-dependent oxidoreductase [Flavilitoribacter nigricans]|uniref:FAD-dependent oxidoreductase n=1 Tax=Flavilitoribacter nigricans (strain ATCC 23147 / DSM 23189 / NBRC 102662 / NCIMB 1420 / SS-2) TaxID=1122177 RepID=A0A2D0N0U3_FLAN2|nr:FAD-dependent oxidoreductase [Flavilitoribacter nigricans]PHN02060.1 FAD-dependent oxidoreductase [Flavilitoribacter nigricans DSM 23189 = NBRC 102662]